MSFYSKNFSRFLSQTLEYTIRRFHRIRSQVDQGRALNTHRWPQHSEKRQLHNRRAG